MKKNLIILASVAAFALSAPVFAADSSYDTKTESTDTAGTTSTSEKHVTSEADSKGNTSKTVKTEKTVDPKGLMNKTSVKTKDTAKSNVDGTTKTTHKKVVNGTTVEDSSSTTKQ